MKRFGKREKRKEEAQSKQRANYTYVKKIVAIYDVTIHDTNIFSRNITTSGY